MCGIKLTERAFRNLLHNLVEMESKKSVIEDQWLNLKEKEEATFFLNDCVNSLDNLVNNISTETTSNNEFPFATVGCTVILQEGDNEDIIKINIILPYEDKIEFGDVSILSPMGKALLRKEKGQFISVNAPGGEFRYKILSIKYSEGQKDN